METQEPLTYSLEFANGTVDLTLTPQRFIVKTQGRGLIDKLRTVDVAVADLEQFCLVPTIGLQNVVDATGTDMVYDSAYDAEFIFSYHDGGKLKKKRLFVRAEDEAFRALLEELKRRRPTASLLDLDPAEAQKRIGVVSGSKALYLVFGVVLGLPLLVGLIVMLFKLHG